MQSNASDLMRVVAIGDLVRADIQGMHYQGIYSYVHAMNAPQMVVRKGLSQV